MYLGPTIINSGTQSALSVLTTNANGAPSTSTITWAFLAGNGFGTVNCIYGTNCAEAYYTATRAGSSCGYYDVVIVASFDGFQSSPVWVFNNAPQSVVQMWGGPGSTTSTGSSPPGWVTPYTYKVLDICQNPINFVAVNETFGTSAEVFPGGANWCLPGPSQQNAAACGWIWGSWQQNSQFDQYGQFVDYLFESNVPGKYPVAWPGGQNGLDESAVSTVLATSQNFYGGSGSNGQGIWLRMLSMTHYLDHGKSQ